MALNGIDETKLKEILKENLTPSDTIKTPERLFGRHKNLQSIDRAFNSAGRQVFIFGDRGIGKTSLALTAAYLHNSVECEPIVVRCGRATGFSDVILAIGNHGISPSDRFEQKGNRGGFNVSIPYLGGVGYTPAAPKKYNLTAPQSINEAIDIIKYVQNEARNKNLVIVIDEMERIQSADEKERFAEFIKNVPDICTNVRFIFCGIASDLTDILGAHPSVGRVLEPIELTRLHHDSLWEIITTTASKLNVTVDRDKLIRIGQISDGFPHYVHLLGESLFWSVFDDKNIVSSISNAHFRAGIQTALERTEAVLRAQFDKATKKTKNTDDYEEALWALADKTSDRRQLTEIYDLSYTQIMLRRVGRDRLPKETFNQRLLSLRSEGHGRILVGHGSGWFGFRENIMRGYVRLDAENKGMQLGTGLA